MYYEYNDASKGYSLVNSDGSKSGNYPKTMISKWELK